MIDVQIIPATEEHLQMILPDVRQADIDELYLEYITILLFLSKNV